MADECKYQKTIKKEWQVKTNLNKIIKNTAKHLSAQNLRRETTNSMRIITRVTNTITRNTIERSDRTINSIKATNKNKT